MNMFTPDKEAEWEKLTDHLCIPSPREWDLMNKYKMRIPDTGIFKIRGRIDVEEPKSFLFEVNEAISYSLNEISKIQTLQDVYSSSSYTIERSIDLLKESIENLSKDFGYKNIPFIYSSQILQTVDQCPSSIWSELKSMAEYFDANRFGRLNFIGAILAMVERGIISIISFEVTYADDDILIMKAVLNLEKFGKPNYAKHRSLKLVFNSESGDLMYQDVTAFAREGAKDYALLSFLNDNKNCPFETREIIEHCNPKVKVLRHKFKAVKDISDTIRQIRSKLKIQKRAAFPIRKEQNSSGETTWRWHER